MTKKLLAGMLILTVCLGVFPCFGNGWNASASEDPILTVACVSDIHTDYGLQATSPYVRNSFYQTANRIGQEESADILLVGGDSTSDHGEVSHRGGWTHEIFLRMLNQYDQLAHTATKTGCSLWACGNHDHEVGEDEGYDSYADYETIMTNSCGTPLSIYRQRDDSPATGGKYPEHPMGLHYRVKGFDFLIINPSYAGQQTFTTGTINWLNERLEKIGSDKTVFLLTHYPLTDFRGISTPTYGIDGPVYTKLTGVLNKYPNLIYLYGHNHGAGESVYISDDTFERITSYNEKGKVVNNRNQQPTSFVSSFMGSMSYYLTSYDPNLGKADPSVVQALMIYVYKDRIVFQMKNYGKAMSHVDPTPWTVTREVIMSGDKKTGGFLASDKINDSVCYDSSLSIGTYPFIPQGAGEPAELNPFGSTTLEGYGISGREKVALASIFSGKAYERLATSLKNVVTDFAAYEFTLRNNGRTFTPEGFVRITLEVPDLFKDAGGLSYGVYYNDENGALCMTDAVLSEDRSELSFLLPTLVPFAISEKSVTEDEAKDVISTGGSTDTPQGSTDSLSASSSDAVTDVVTNETSGEISENTTNKTTDSSDGPQSSSADGIQTTSSDGAQTTSSDGVVPVAAIVILCILGGILVVGSGVVVFVLMRRKKQG